jgi:pimeloyl-ACP methyl ester carboxylesterase
MKNWALVAPKLAADHRVISFDQRGHGLTSGGGTDYSLEILAEDLAGLADKLQLENLCLIGHSMGSMVAQTFVLAHAHRVASLVLVSSTAAPVDTVERKLLTEAADAALGGGIDAAWPIHQNLWPEWQRVMFAGDPELAERVRAEFTRTSVAGYVGFARAACRRIDLRPRLSEIGCPTLVVAGSHDPRRVATSSEIADLIPGAQYVVIEGAGHTPQIETPGLFLELLGDFLSGR